MTISAVTGTLIDATSPRCSARATTAHKNTVIATVIKPKSKIHTANQPVFNQIFRLAELKGQIKILKSMDVSEGKTSERYSSVQSVKEVEINVAERDSIIKAIEAEIESLQDELDVHNANTII